MCYASPGPRCGTHAKESLEKASKNLESVKEKVSVLEQEMVKEQEKNPRSKKNYNKRLAKLNTQLNKAMVKRKTAVENYWETKTGNEELVAISMKNGMTQSQMDTIKVKIQNNEPLTENDFDHDNANARGKMFAKKFAEAHKSYLSKMEAYKRAQETKNLIDRKNRPEYVASIESKHITGNGSGSKFTDQNIKTVDDVLAKTSEQRGNLEGDDRDKLIAHGADPSAFLPSSSGVRYLMVKTSGTVGIKDTATLKDNTVLTVTAKGKNDGKPPSLSFSTDVKEQPQTEYATVILGPRLDDNKEPIEGTTTLWTMHPGTPTQGIRSDDIRGQGLDHGSKLTVKELREKFGKDIKVNTKLIG